MESSLRFNEGEGKTAMKLPPQKLCQDLLTWPHARGWDPIPIKVYRKPKVDFSCSPTFLLWSPWMEIPQPKTLTEDGIMPISKVCKKQIEARFQFSFDPHHLYAASQQRSLQHGITSCTTDTSHSPSPGVSCLTTTQHNVPTMHILSAFVRWCLTTEYSKI